MTGSRSKLFQIQGKWYRKEIKKHKMMIFHFANRFNYQRVAISCFIPFYPHYTDTFVGLVPMFGGLPFIQRRHHVAGVDSDVFSGPLGPLDDYFTDIEGQEEDETCHVIQWMVAKTCTS